MSAQPAPAKRLRCAVYTRKSSEEGLEQDFNSLHAQREACEAYISSQRHEGWTLVRTPYDDGGYSGGSMERPGLAALLADIDARRIDIVVVYKVDRLTRSLADFAKIVERFDAAGVSFVSVTQSFNTTTSMGRLTLNVLLSFAQFEREVTGERIRDKIAASKRKGLWMGGNPPLGYRVEARKLVVAAEEAMAVRTIFAAYLEVRSLGALVAALRHKGILSKRAVLRDGSVRGGIPFTKGPLAHLLGNRTYVGEINHRSSSFPGQHASIVDRTVFEAVQTLRTEHRRVHHRRRQDCEGLLSNLLFDAAGRRFRQETVRKGPALYRYYVLRQEGDNAEAKGRATDGQGAKATARQSSIEKKQATSITHRINAAAIESAVLGAVKALAGDSSEDVPSACIERMLARVSVHSDRLTLELTEPGEAAARSRTIDIAWAQAPHSPRRRIVVPAASSAESVRPIRAENRALLLEAIVRARLGLDRLASGDIASIDELAEREGKSSRQIQTALSLAFLSPAIVRGVLQGALRHSAGVASCANLPMDWRRQIVP